MIGIRIDSWRDVGTVRGVGDLMVKVLVQIDGFNHFIGEGHVDYKARIIKLTAERGDGVKDYVFPFENVLYFRFLTLEEYKDLTMR